MSDRNARRAGRGSGASNRSTSGAGRGCRRRLRAPAATAAAALGLLAAASCSSHSTKLTPASQPSTSAAPSPTASATRSATTTAALRYAPLLGGPGATAATVHRPALGVPIVAGSGLPAPLGLGAADVIFDEVGSGGNARLLAVYQSRDADPVGPVDDNRPDDSRVLAVTNGLLGHAGGVPSAVVQLERSAVADLGRPAHGTAYTTRASYPAPYDVFTSTKALYDFAPSGRPSAPSLFSYTGMGRPPALGTPRSKLTVSMPGQSTQTWEYSASKRLWRMVKGPVPGMTVTNLVVQTVTYKPARVGKNAYVEVATVVGDGPATVAAGRLVGTGTWRKPSAKTLTSYVDATSTPFRLEPGRTWVVLAPEGSTVRAS